MGENGSIFQKFKNCSFLRTLVNLIYLISVKFVINCAICNPNYNCCNIKNYHSTAQIVVKNYFLKKEIN